MNVVATANLFVAGRRGIPVLENARRIALPVAGRIAKTVEEVSRRTCRRLDACRRITGDEGLVMFDHVDLTLDRTGYDLAQLGVVVQGVAVQPVAFERTARQVDVDLPG